MVLCKNKKKNKQTEKDGEMLSYQKKVVFQACHKPRSHWTREL